MKRSRLFRLVGLKDKTTDFKLEFASRLEMCMLVHSGSTELSVGPFCVTLPNPTHQLTDSTQSITSGKISTQTDPTQYN